MTDKLQRIESQLINRLVQSLLYQNPRVEIVDYLVKEFRPKPTLVKSEPSNSLIESLKKEKGLYGWQLEAATTRSLDKQATFLADTRPSILYCLASNLSLTNQSVSSLTKTAVSNKNSNIAINIIRYHLAKVSHKDLEALLKLISFREGKDGIPALAFGILRSDYQTILKVFKLIPTSLYNSSNSTKDAIFSYIETEMLGLEQAPSFETLTALYEIYGNLPIEKYLLCKPEFIESISSAARKNPVFTPLLNLTKKIEEEFHKEFESFKNESYRSYRSFIPNGLSTRFVPYEINPLIHVTHYCSFDAVLSLAKHLGLDENILNNHSSWAKTFIQIDNLSENQIVKLLKKTSSSTKRLNHSYDRLSNQSTAFSELFAHSSKIRILIAENFRVFPAEFLYQPLNNIDYIDHLKEVLLKNQPIDQKYYNILYHLTYFLYNPNDSFTLKKVYLMILLSQEKNDYLAAEILRSLSASEYKELFLYSDNDLLSNLRVLLNHTLTADFLLSKDKLSSVISCNLAEYSPKKWSTVAFMEIGRYIFENILTTENLETLLNTADIWDNNTIELVNFANKV